MSEFQTKLHSVPSGGFLTDRDKDKKPILDVRELGIDFGGLTAVDSFNLMIGRNEITGDRKSTRLNSSHQPQSRMPSSA